MIPEQPGACWSGLAKLESKATYKDCLISTPHFSPEEIREIRERQHFTQPAIARYLSVSKNPVSDWERGVKKPGGPAKQRLTLIKHKGLEAISFGCPPEALAIDDDPPGPHGTCTTGLSS
jgi:DNA-binding transcriptional regulator YiaG